jgi:hypothetical protein
MRNLLLALALGASLSGTVQTRPPAAFDPVGKWTYATHDDAGAAITGTMEIAGKPGAYQGTLVSAPDRMLAIADVLTSPNGMVVIANLPDGGVAVIKVWKDAAGKLQAGWGPIRTVIPATVDRVTPLSAR